MTLRALGSSVLAGACVVGLAIVSPAPAKAQPSGISLGVDVKYPGLVKEVASRRGQYRYDRHWVTAMQSVPINIEATSAPTPVAISVSGQVPTNVMAMTAIGDAAAN
jgi:hypothetical protein